MVVISAIKPAADSAYSTTHFNVIGRRLYVHPLTWGARRDVKLNNVDYHVRNVLLNQWSGPFPRDMIIFDGATYGYVPYERSRICATDLTICLWVYPDADGAMTFMANGLSGDPNNQWSLSKTAGNELIFTWFDGAAEVTESSGLFVPKNTWTFIAMRRRERNPASLAASTCEFWVDTNTWFTNSTRGAMVTAGGNPDLYIGRDAIAATGYFSGTMCFMQVVDYAAKMDEIEAARDTFTTIPNGCLQYAMVDGSGDTLADLDVFPEVWM